MKTSTLSSALLATLALSAPAMGHAQDSTHAHHAHSQTTTTSPKAVTSEADTSPDPHAAHSAAADAAVIDPHAGHAMPPAQDSAADTDPHAVHRAAAGSADPHAGHAMPVSASQGAADPHALHRAEATADAHAHHSAPAAASAAPDAHAGHTMPAADPHAGHAMPDASDTDAHAGHDGDLPADAAPREPIPVLTDADRAAAFPELHHENMSHGPTINSLVRLNRLEGWDTDDGSGQAWEADAWIGGDVQRVWLRSGGEREGGRTASADLEVLYGRGISPWWDVVAGARHDFALGGESRTWAAIGVIGMAPYRFEVSATAYIGQSGQSAANLEIEYEMLLTNRLILQPVVELDFNGKDDPQRHVGSGLSSAEAGVRLRYEIKRRLAPYIGVVHERSFGGTADYRRDKGEAARDTRFVAGVRIWF